LRTIAARFLRAAVCDAVSAVLVMSACGGAHGSFGAAVGAARGTV
jgi:hypothetical protein